MDFKLRMDARYFNNEELLEDIKRVAMVNERIKNSDGLWHGGIHRKRTRGICNG